MLSPAGPPRRREAAAGMQHGRQEEEEEDEEEEEEEDEGGGAESALEKSPFQLTPEDVYDISSVVGRDLLQLSAGPRTSAAAARLQFSIVRVLEMLEALVSGGSLAEERLRLERDRLRMEVEALRGEGAPGSAPQVGAGPPEGVGGCQGAAGVPGPGTGPGSCHMSVTKPRLTPEGLEGTFVTVCRLLLQPKGSRRGHDAWLGSLAVGLRVELTAVYTHSYRFSEHGSTVVPLSAPVCPIQTLCCLSYNKALVLCTRKADEHDKKKKDIKKKALGKQKSLRYSVSV